MELPIRIVDAAPVEPVISVDGAFGARGLCLSHWPGNTTPPQLKHDLSTGIALAFSRLAVGAQRELAHGCVAIANNHYDTDGVCALFAVRHPELALPRADRLLEAAAAGDLFRAPSELAFQIDCIVSGLADEKRSPWRERFAGKTDRERHEMCVVNLMNELPRLLDGDVDDYVELWRAELEDLRADRTDVAAAARDEITHLDFAVFTGLVDRSSSRARTSGGGFDPGRHALFGTTAADRVLVIGPSRAGATYRFLLSTISWFELISRRAQSRPDLEALVARLNELEGSQEADDIAWRSQGAASPSPELWFGAKDHAMFAEHAPVLAPSRLDPARVRRELSDALRASWTFPD
jgi:hypothetical protein